MTQPKKSQRSKQRYTKAFVGDTRPRRVAFRWIIVAVVTLTLIAFFPVLYNGFVNWDDFFNLVDNPNYRGLSFTDLSWMFSTFHLSLYRPVTWMTWGADYLLWNMNPAGYHLTSLLFHAANAALFSCVALALFRLMPAPQPPGEFALRLGSAFAGLVFSLHPLRVEAVAWASARNDLVSALFLLLAVYCYLRAVSDPTKLPAQRKWFTAALIIYLVSLFAKGIGVTFPFILLLLDMYPLKRLPWLSRQWLRKEYRWILLEKIPFLILATGAGIAAVLAKQEGQVFHGLEKFGITLRLAESFYGLAFYLWKTILPFRLSPLYQRSTQPDPWAWPFVISAVMVLAVTTVLLLYRRRWPATLACWLYYVITLLPVLGIVQFGPQVVADRYSYLSCMSWALLAGAGFAALWERSRAATPVRPNPSVVLAAGTIVLAIFAIATWQQSGIWRDSERLWRTALSIDPASSIAHHNLATALKSRGSFQEAISHYRRTIEIDPLHARAYHDLGEIAAQQSDFDGAIKHYQNALKIDPRSALTYHYLGTAYAAQRQIPEAVKNFFEALRFDPNNAKIHNSFGNVLAVAGDWVGAAEHYRKAAALDSSAPEPYFNLGNLLSRENQLEQASFYYRRAILIDPNYAQAHFYLGRILAAQGKLDEAANHFRLAVAAEPRYLGAHQSLIQALLELGKKEEARRHYEAHREILGAPLGGQNFQR